MLFKVDGSSGPADIEATSMKEAAEKYMKELVPVEVWPLGDDEAPIEVSVDGKFFDVIAWEEPVPLEHLTDEARAKYGDTVKAAYVRAAARD